MKRKEEIHSPKAVSFKGEVIGTACSRGIALRMLRQHDNSVTSAVLNFPAGDTYTPAYPEGAE